MESSRPPAGQLRRMCVCVAVLIAALATAVAPAAAEADSPLLEFASAAADFPIGFTATGGEVTAAMAEFDTVVHCSGSSGSGQLTGPRTAVASWVFTECETQTGSEAGRKCESAGASEREIRTGAIEAELVYLDQARHEVAMLLNPHGGIYMEFACAGEAVRARGPFLSPVGPVNTEVASFSASLSRLGPLQAPSEFENGTGGRIEAIPLGERGAHPPATTGVELGFAIHTAAPLAIRAVSAEEVEARRHASEADAAAAARRRQEDEAAARRRQEEEQARAPKPPTRAQRLAKALKRCRKFSSSQRRAHCETRARNRYGGHRVAKSPKPV